MNQAEAIDLYLGVLARRGRRPTTINGYRRLLNHLADLAPGRDTHELDLADYERFLNRWTGAAPSTLASNVSLAKGYSRFLFDAGHQGPHRNGLLVWHDPPVVFVGGKPVLPLTRAEVDRLQRIGTAAS